MNSPLVYVFVALALVLGGAAAWRAATADSLPDVQFSAPFRPNESFADLNLEYISLKNAEKTSVDLSGWTLSNESGATFTFPVGTVMPRGAIFTVYSGCAPAEAEAPARKIYWCSRKPIWPDEIGHAVLRMADGTVVQDYRYEYSCSICGD
ncbi:MAG: lamin tail domain-containing protein [Candidatus Bipolaricaulota bacterium]